MVFTSLVLSVNWRKWLREPLVHFLIAGGVMFLVAGWLGEQASDKRTIHLSRDDLLVYMQGRAQVYDEETFAALLQEMAPEDRERLVRDAALQEALYREGQALNLTEADPLIRQRVVQQMRILLVEEAAAQLEVTEQEARDYYQRNRARYALEPAMTFTHVFLRDNNTRAQASALLGQLNEQNVAASDAGEFGDRFLYQLNYSEASPAMLASQFGYEFSRATFELDADGSWHGPIRSDHGWHLLKPIRSSAARAPGYEKIAQRVHDDVLADKRQTAADTALGLMLARYEVELSDELEQ